MKNGVPKAVNKAFDERTKMTNEVVNAVLHPGSHMRRNAITSGMRGIYCKGRESCIIQRITIVGMHDNNCTIIITAGVSLPLER